MKVIGITGGVGAGKSSVLSIIKELTNCRIIHADELAKSLEEKGEVCYAPLVKLLGDGILDSDGSINIKKMAEAIFLDASGERLEAVNAIIHPEVKRRIISIIKEEESKNIIDYLFIEAALLIEERYDLICDELWYVYADVEVRRDRLKKSRGYSDEKIDAILASQLDDATFRKYCKVVIDNSSDINDTRKELETVFGRK